MGWILFAYGCEFTEKFSNISDSALCCIAQSRDSAICCTAQSRLRAMQHSVRRQENFWLEFHTEFHSAESQINFLLFDSSSRISPLIRIYIQNRFSTWISGPRGIVWQKTRGWKSHETVHLRYYEHLRKQRYGIEWILRIELIMCSW
jgi:hypothetical protein